MDYGLTRLLVRCRPLKLPMILTQNARQVRECYDEIGGNLKWDGRTNFWSDIKNECGRILKPNGKIICFGWNSMGLGKNRGFEMTRVLLVPHGGNHNDTICTVEVKR